MEKIFCFAGGLLVGFAVSSLYVHRMISQSRIGLFNMLVMVHERLKFLYMQFTLLKVAGIDKSKEMEDIKTVLDRMEKDIREWKK